MAKEFDVERLEHSLVQVIEQIPALGGKLIVDEGCILLDTDGLGVLVEYHRSDIETPPHGNEIFPLSGYEFCTPVPDMLNRHASEWPLLTIKITTFADGNHCIGIRHNHALADGGSIVSFLFAWDSALRHGGRFIPEFSREKLLALAASDGSRPSGQSGIACVDGQVIKKPAQFFATELFPIRLAAEDFTALKALAEAAADVSVNDLLNALVFKAYGASAVALQMMVANLPFDLRRIKASKIPPNYFGNSVLLRSFAMPAAELRDCDVMTLARRFAAFNEPNLQVIAQDIAFYQAEYAAGRYNGRGVYAGFTPLVANGGIYINNMIIGSKFRLNLGGAQIGGGLIVKQPFGLRMVLISSMLHGDVYLQVALEKQQAEGFRRHWREMVAQLLAEQL
jgi:transferase family protein